MSVWTDPTEEYSKVGKKDIATMLLSAILAIAGGATSTLWAGAKVSERVAIQGEEIDRLREKFEDTASIRDVEKLSDKMDKIQEKLNEILTTLATRDR